MLPPAGAFQASALGRVAWFVFLDDLHLDFRNTGYIRKFLGTISSDLIREGDAVAARASGPSRFSIDLSSNRKAFDDGIRMASGNGLSLEEQLQGAGPDVFAEVRYRAGVALAAASEFTELVESVTDRRNVMLYVSSGYQVELPTQLDKLVSAARRSRITIIAIDPRGLPGALFKESINPSAHASLRRMAELTGGIALLDEKEVVEASTRIAEAIRK
jgi:hypothetical protein